MEKMTLDLLFGKVLRPGHVISVSPKESIANAAKILKKENVGLMIVIDNGHLVGVVSERDIVHRWVGTDRFTENLIVKDIMTSNVEVVSTGDTLYDCYLRFLARNCRHLPVLDPFGSVVGVLSMRDVVKIIVNDLTGKKDKKASSSPKKKKK